MDARGFETGCCGSFNYLFYDSMTDPNCLFSSGLKPPSTDLSESAKPGLFVGGFLSSTKKTLTLHSFVKHVRRDKAKPKAAQPQNED